MSTNIFEQASRMALRFESMKGDITVEQLWSLPLSTSQPGKLSLESIGRNVMQKLSNTTATAFLEETPSPERAQDELRLEILKHIRDVKQAEFRAFQDASKRRAERERLLDILEKKKEGQLSELSIEELEARVAALSS